jgi:ubiquinone/menaquinone biosynthesis C-methylase UbiE
MSHHKFDVRKLEKLNDEKRFEQLIPEVMWDALGDPNPSTIVEIGAGTGLFASRFADMALDVAVYAVDIEPAMVAWMEQNRLREDGKFHPVLADETHVPLPDAVADIVMTINLHHELEFPATTYAEAFRLLKPGGQILVVDWAPTETLGGPPQEIRATEDQLREMLESVGFEASVAHFGLPWHSLVTALKAE